MKIILNLFTTFYAFCVKIYSSRKNPSKNSFNFLHNAKRQMCAFLIPSLTSRLSASLAQRCVFNYFCPIIYASTSSFLCCHSFNEDNNSVLTVATAAGRRVTVFGRFLHNSPEFQLFWALKIRIWKYGIFHSFMKNIRNI